MGGVGGDIVSGIKMKAADFGDFIAASRCEIAIDYTGDLRQHLLKSQLTSHVKLPLLM